MFGRADRRQAVGQPHPPALVVEPQFRRRCCDLDGGEPVDRQALARQCRCRCRQFAPRHTAEALDRRRVAAHRARDRESERAVDVAVALDLRPGEQLGLAGAGQRIGGGVEAARRHWAEIDGLGMARAGAVHDHETDRPEPAVPRLDRGQGQRRRHGGIDRGPAHRQDFGADNSGGAALRGDDAALGRGSRLADLPILGQVHRGRPLRPRRSNRPD